MKTFLFAIVMFFIAGPVLATPQLNCFDIMRNHRAMLDDVSIRLCKGAKSNAPVQCFDFAASRGLDIYDRVSLCAGAEDLSPLNCFDMSRSRNLNSMQALVLCSAR